MSLLLTCKECGNSLLRSRMHPKGYVCGHMGCYQFGKLVGVAPELAPEQMSAPNESALNPGVVLAPQMAYPDNNPKTLHGLAKAPLHLVPTRILYWLAEAFANGSKKYGPFNWRTKKISATVYYAAAMRHLTAWYEREQLAEDSGVHHLAHAAACLAMIADVEGTELFNDDRPPKRPPPIKE